MSFPHSGICIIRCRGTYLVHNKNFMKKVALLTIHLGANFGSNLQTIATVETLKKHGCETEVVNYIPDRCTWNRFFKDGFKSAISVAKMFILLPVKIANSYIYNSYLSKYVQVSKTIYAKDDFMSACPKANVYVTGSDQVWNSKHNEGLDRRYYFDGFPDDAVKIAYSSSIGREELDVEEYAEVRRMLGSYKAISVREASAGRLIEGMGYRAIHLLDPTFMLTRENWKNYMSKRLVKEPYLIVYLPYNVHDKSLIYQSIRKIADKKQLKVISFSWHILPDKLADKTVFFSNPGDFLSLMYYADYVMTNSFHGTAFSINLNKQFSVYLPSSFGTRIVSILDLCGLGGRLLEPDEIISDGKMDETIDYMSVNVVLDEERRKAHTFLEQALKS